MAEYVYDEGLVLLEGTSLPAPLGTAGVFRAVPGGPAVQVYDLNGSEIPSVKVGEFGVHQQFTADIPHGVLDFGSKELVKESKQQREAGFQALQAINGIDGRLRALEGGTTSGFARLKALPRYPTPADGNDGDVFLYHPNYTG